MPKSGLYLLLLLLAFHLASPVFLPGAVFTLSDGQTLSISSFSWDSSVLKYSAGTGTQTLSRSRIQDISFSGTDRQTDQLSTEAANLLPYLEQGKALLKKYPDSSSITVLDEGEFVHRADGTNLNTYRGIMLLVKEESLGAAEVGLSYDPNRERVRIVHARCLTPNGVVHSLSPDQIKVSKGSSGGEYFDQQQQISFTIPEVSMGSLVDYCYETEEFNPFDKNLFQGMFFFQGGDPIVDSTLRVTMPASQPLNFLNLNFPASSEKPKTVQANSQITYTWTFTGMAPIIGEPNMPPMREIVPGVAFSLHKDWSYMFKRLKPMFEKRFVLTDAVKKKVDELTAGCKTMEEKMARLYQFCQKEIRYISIKGNLASNQVGHAAEETLKSRYGDCTDKGMLLATMLKHLGVEAYPVGLLTNTAGKAIRDLPLFDSNHCITEVYYQGKRFYLDSTATDYRFPYFRSDDHDTMAENPLLEKHQEIPLPPPEDNAFSVKRELVISPDGSTKVTFKGEANGSGEAAMRGSARSLKPEEFEKAVRATIAAITADYNLEIATHSDPLDFSGPYTNTSIYTLKNYCPRSGRYMLFEIPYFRLGFPEISLATRTYDLIYTTTSLRTEDVTIELPLGFQVKYLPPPLKLSTPYLEFNAEYRVDGNQGPQGGGKILLKRRIAFTKRRVPVADYQTHKETLEKIARFTEERIFLEEIAQKKEGNK